MSVKRRTKNLRKGRKKSQFFQAIKFIVPFAVEYFVSGKKIRDGKFMNNVSFFSLSIE